MPGRADIDQVQRTRARSDLATDADRRSKGGVEVRHRKETRMARQYDLQLALEKGGFPTASACSIC